VACLLLLLLLAHKSCLAPLGSYQESSAAAVVALKRFDYVSQATTVGGVQEQSIYINSNDIQ
jgi:hypothetical protein